MIRSLTTLLGIAWLAVACSGGGGGSASEGGIGGSGITRGVITATGSATVAGTTYDTDSATLIFDGDEDASGSLELGMTVRVTGDRSGDTGTATEVEFDDAIEGPVSALDLHPTNPRKADVTILGQLVVIENGFTVFDGVTFETIVPGDVLEVSGFRDGDGEITATRVELVTNPTSVVELKGVVENLDDANPDDAHFTIGSITIRFRIGTTELPDGAPEEGDFVEVLGEFDDVDTVDATTALGRIELEGPDVGDVGDYEIEGIVSNFASLFDFEVDGQPVSAGGFGIQFEPASPGFVADGARIEVEGRLDGGVLIASEVKQRGGEVRIAAELGVAPVDGMLTLIGVIEVVADSSTRFDSCPAPVPPSSDPGDRVDAIPVGEFVELRGVQVGPLRVLATEIKCEDTGEEIELQGRVQAFDSTFEDITILGVEIPVGAVSVFKDFPDPAVNPPLDSLDEFFSFLASNPNALLAVTDKDDGDATVLDAADEIEYEEDDD